MKLVWQHAVPGGGFAVHPVAGSVSRFKTFLFTRRYLGGVLEYETPNMQCAMQAIHAWQY